MTGRCSSTWKIAARRTGLIRQLQKKYKEFQDISNIEVKIYPARLQRRAPPSIPRQISPAAAKDITQMANSIDNPNLKQALLRLASRANKPAETN